MKGWIKKYNWKFILLYFFPLCWIYKVTLSNYFNIYDRIGALLLQTRGLSVVLFSAVGWMLMSRSSVSSSVKIALGLSSYMLLHALLIGENINVGVLAIFYFWSITFYITERNTLNSDDIGILAIIASVICNLMALDLITYYPLIPLLDLEPEQHVAASNSVYYVMSSAAFIFLVPNNIIKLLFLILPCVAILIVGKSTALLAMALSICLYFYKQITDPRNRWKSILVAIVIICVVLFTDNELFDIGETIGGFTDDVDSGGNGRIEIWTAVLREFSFSDFGSKLFGHGLNAINDLVGLSGHNDFIEMLFDYGVLGLSLYLYLWWSLIQRIKFFAPKSDTRMAYIISIAMYITASMFSNFIVTQIQMLFFVMFWGILYSQRDKKNITK